MKTRTTAIYALSHFAVDFLCAGLLFSRVYGSAGWVYGTLLYNACAFALQMPFGLLADAWNRNRAVAAAGCLLVAAAWLPGLPAMVLCVVAGIGNALFHVGGGVDILNLSGGNGGMLGVFVAPGAFGIFFGTLLGKRGAFSARLILLLPVAAAAVLCLCDRTENRPVKLPPAKEVLSPAVLCLVLVVILRSYAGFLFSFPWKAGAVMPVLLTAAVVLGKALGGLVADRAGLCRTALASLGLSALLFLFSARAAAGLAAVLLFNMSMPLTLRLAADRFPGAKGFSFGLLTFALFLGFLFCWLGLQPAGRPALYASAALLSAALLLPAGVKR